MVTKDEKSSRVVNARLHALRGLIQGYLRQAISYRKGRRFTQGDLAIAIGLDPKELSLRLNATRGKQLSAAEVRAIVRILIEQAAITTITQAKELVALSGVPLSEAEQQQPPFVGISHTSSLAASATTPKPAGGTPDLATFHERVRELYRQADPYSDGRRPRQQDLAAAIGLAPTELSRRLNNLAGSTLSSGDVRAIIRTLAAWGAISTRAQAMELLQIIAVPPFSEAEWTAPPLDLLTEQPAIRPQSAPDLPTHNLPRSLSSFVGRTRELDNCARLLERNPLLIITGPGGIGKTRFSLELARLLLPRYQAGVYLVELVAITNPELVGQAVVQTLGCPPMPGLSVVELLVSYLKDRQLLLILDNCEQVSDAVVMLAQQLLSHCSQLTILATSRERLGLVGETLFPLGALTLPDAAALAPDQLASVEAVQLFLSRAQAVQPDFQLTTKNAILVAGVVQQLEGVPLAIELAAPLVQVLGIGQLATRLSERLRWLVSSSPAVPSRQRTLRASITWSYDLLEPDEQLLFRRLAIFSGGWELSAAEVICADGQASDGWVLRALARLVRSSLVQTATDSEGELRYSWLVAVRDFAQEQLAASGESEAITHSHAYLYLTLTEQANTERGYDLPVAWQRRLEREHDNIRAALNWAAQAGEHELLLRLCIACVWFWLVRGYLSEGRSWLNQAVTNSASVSTRLRAKALQDLGSIAVHQGDFDAAAAALEQSLTYYREAGDDAGLAKTLVRLGTVFTRMDGSDRAPSLFEEALAIYRRLDDKGGTTLALSNIAIYYSDRGNYTVAQPMFEEVLALAREVGNQQMIAYALGNVALVLYRQHNYPFALERNAEAERIFKQLGTRLDMAMSQLNIGDVLRAMGDGEAAEARFRASLQAYSEMGEREYTASVLERLAGLATDRQQPMRAARLFGAAARLREEINSQLPPVEQAELDHDVATARQQLNSSGFTLAWAEGQQLTLEQAVGYALATVDEYVLAQPEPARLAAKLV